MNNENASPAVRVVAVVQARMGSTRLPGKVLVEIESQPLLAWVIQGVQAIQGVSDVVVATTSDAADGSISAVAKDLGVAVHRGSVHDVLTRCYDAVAPFDPDVVIRQTADNPFPDPIVAASQVRTLVVGGFDYVGIAGWPLGIAAEACRFSALEAAHREATDSADREHVLPFVYRQPERFRLGRLDRVTPAPTAILGARYTVDTEDDLTFAQALAARLGHGPPIQLAELESILAVEPELLELNAAVAQRSWREAQLVEEGR